MLANALKGLRTSYPRVSRGEQIPHCTAKFLLAMFPDLVFVGGEPS